MAKGRSVYNITINSDPNLVNNLIQSFLQANNYELQNKNGEQYYRAGDAMVQGYRYFKYEINGATLTVYAWFKGVLGEMPIEQNSLSMVAMNYRNSLNTLFQEIDKLNKGGTNVNNNMNYDPNTGQPLNNTQANYDPNTGQALNQINNNPGNLNPNIGQPQSQNNYQQPVQNNANQFAQTFQDETTKKQEKMCEIGFWLSILGFLCSFLGVSYGVIIYILDFYFASQGLKTRKRGKAIATIVLSVASIIIIIYQLVTA